MLTDDSLAWINETTSIQGSIARAKSCDLMVEVNKYLDGEDIKQDWDTSYATIIAACLCSADYSSLSKIIRAVQLAYSVTSYLEELNEQDIEEDSEEDYNEAENSEFETNSENESIDNFGTEEIQYDQNLHNIVDKSTKSKTNQAIKRGFRLLSGLNDPNNMKRLPNNNSDSIQSGVDDGELESDDSSDDNSTHKYSSANESEIEVDESELVFADEQIINDHSLDMNGNMIISNDHTNETETTLSEMIQGILGQLWELLYGLSENRWVLRYLATLLTNTVLPSVEWPLNFSNQLPRLLALTEPGTRILKMKLDSVSKLSKIPTLVSSNDLTIDVSDDEEETPCPDSNIRNIEKDIIDHKEFINSLSSPTLPLSNEKTPNSMVNVMPLIEFSFKSTLNAEQRAAFNNTTLELVPTITEKNEDMTSQLPASDPVFVNVVAAIITLSRKTHFTEYSDYYYDLIYESITPGLINDYTFEAFTIIYFELIDNNMPAAYAPSFLKRCMRIVSLCSEDHDIVQYLIAIARKLCFSHPTDTEYLFARSVDLHDITSYSYDPWFLNNSLQSSINNVKKTSLWELRTLSRSINDFNTIWTNPEDNTSSIPSYQDAVSIEVESIEV